MVDLIDLEKNRFNDVVANELEPRVPEEVHEVVLPPGEEIVNDDDVVAARDELVDEVAADEAGPAGDDDPEAAACDPDGDAARAGNGGEAAQARGSREESTGLGWAHAGERGLDDEKGGADKDPHQDEQQPLLSQQVVDGSRQRSRVLYRFGGVR